VTVVVRPVVGPSWCHPAEAPATDTSSILSGLAGTSQARSRNVVGPVVGPSSLSGLLSAAPKGGRLADNEETGAVAGHASARPRVFNVRPRGTDRPPARCTTIGRVRAPGAVLRPRGGRVATAVADDAAQRGLIAPELVNRQGFAHSMPRLPRQFHAPFADGADLPPAPSAIPAGCVVGGLGG